MMPAQSDQMEMPIAAFLQREAKPPGFSQLVRAAVGRRRAMELVLAADQATITLGPAGAATVPTLTGTWSTVDIAVGHEPRAQMEKLILPLLMRPQRFVLPHQDIHVVDRDHRSVADFFARNLFFALSRSGTLVLKTLEESHPAPPTGRDLQIRYFFVLKHFLAERSFEGHNAAEMLNLFVANCYLPVLTFDSPLLEQAAAAVRGLVSALGPGGLASYKARLLDTRETLLAAIRA